jgi:hypothetical protein
MLSILRQGLVYKDVSPEIPEHDSDIDAEEWNYEGRDVYRGSVDPRYISEGLKVHWLYDEDLKRVGLVEHEAENPEVFRTSWIYDNPFATFFQDERWVSTERTLWSKLGNEAYQDCLEDDFKTVSDRALKSGVLLATPNMLIEKPQLYVCENCGKKTLMQASNCQTAKAFDLVFSDFTVVFLDDQFVIYELLPMSGDLLPTPQSDAYAQEQQVEQSDSQSDLQELKDAHSPPQA